jgi:hypothetical protein
VTSFRDRLDACDAAARAQLDPEEVVLAVGRCSDISLRGSIENGGAAWTYVMITDRRLRWMTHADPRFEASLDLDDVTAVSERSRGHRYAIELEHRPLMRSHHAPAHRVLRFAWGNAVATSPFIRTELGFSRRDTEAAQALRDQLDRRRMPGPGAPGGAS